MKHLAILRYLLPMFFLLGLMAEPMAATADPFPRYPCLAANIAFWKKVYSQYPSTEGLIHDRWNLAIIYEVVSVGNDAQAGERTVEAVKEKYRRLLLTLAQGQPPATPDEKQVAALFGAGCNATVLRQAADNIRFQRCLSDRFRAGLVRSGRYMEQIKEIFSQYGLPTDLAYLPHVESSFDYQAYSKSGAAGIWQLMPATGRRFLNINSAVDERRDPLLATRAAARHLQGNYRVLQDWPLAITAYNHGLTAMLRAKKAQGTYEKIFRDYDGANFGFASQNFYSEFLAALEIAKNYRQYFKDLRPDEPLRSSTYTVNSRARLTELASHFKVDADTLAGLNPALREPVLKGRLAVPKGYLLRLPRTVDGSRVAALPVRAEPAFQASAPTPPAPAKAKRASTHRVKRGETIVIIAERYGVSPQALLASNQLDHRALISVGQNLRIPPPPAKAKGKKGAH